MHLCYTTIVLGIRCQTFHPSRSRMLLKRKRSMTMHLCYITIVWALVVERFIPIIYKRKRIPVIQQLFGHWKSNVSSQSVTFAVIKEN